MCVWVCACIPQRPFVADLLRKRQIWQSPGNVWPRLRERRAALGSERTHNDTHKHTHQCTPVSSSRNSFGYLSLHFPSQNPMLPLSSLPQLPPTGPSENALQYLPTTLFHYIFPLSHPFLPSSVDPPSPPTPTFSFRSYIKISFELIKKYIK